MKCSVTFKGFDDLVTDLDRIGGDIKEAANEALEWTETITQQQLRTRAAKYRDGGRKGYATGAMYGAILRSPRPVWVGYVGYVDVGFDLTTEGGVHSIFIMHGTPRYAKDANVWNAVKGARTKRLIRDKQEQIIMNALNLARGR